MTSPTIFISFAHKDEEWKDRVVTHLRVLELEGILDVWEDRRIEAGDDWHAEIEKAINAASIAVLLISANFLTSKFILDTEVPRLLQRREKEGVRVILLIIKPCAWQQVKWLSPIQARPKDGRALSSGNENQIDTDLAALANEISTIVQRDDAINSVTPHPESSLISQQASRQSTNAPQPIAESKFIVVGNMRTSRQHHVSVLLPNGNVLIAGGYDPNGTETKILASVELFEVSNQAFTIHGRLVQRRYFSAATLLATGTLLIVGGVGENGHALDTAELYNPVIGSFSIVGRMIVARRGHTATLMKNGKVLVAGGQDNTGRMLGSAEIYDPVQNTFTTTGNMSTARLTEHTPNAVLLRDGRVLIAGGYDGITGAIASAELYDFAKGIFVPIGNMTMKRAGHTMTLLPTGKVLISGGYADRFGYLNSAELYDPDTGSFELTPNMEVSHFHHTATLLSNGQVLIVGGSFPLTELYSSNTNDFREYGNLVTTRYLHTAVLLPNNRVLLIGGAGGAHSISSVEITSEIP